MSSGSEDLAPAAVSAQLAALGPYFAISFHGSGDASPTAAVRASGGRSADSPRRGGAVQQEPESPWRSMAELVEDQAVLAERVAAVRAFLAAGTGQDAEAVELRVAASVGHLGLVARVVSPLFALAVGFRRCGVVRGVDLRWQPELASTFPLSVHESVLEDESVDFFVDDVLGGIVAEVETAVARFGVNRRILRGNVASALAGAAKTLSAGWPGLRGSATAYLGELLASPYLVSSAELETDGAFRRRSCCLIYRAAPDNDGALCGDCVLARPVSSAAPQPPH